VTTPKCQHIWSEDYVCTACGRVRIAGEPFWARVYKWPSRKRGARDVWLAMWTCADADTTSPGPVWPGNAALCERSGGLSTRTVQGYLVELQALGWLRRTDETRRSFVLAWGKPREDWAAEFRTLGAEDRTPNAEDRTTRNPAPTMRRTAPHAQDSAHLHAEDRTHTLVDRGVDLGSDMGEAPATPHERTRHEPRSDNRASTPGPGGPKLELGQARAGDPGTATPQARARHEALAAERKNRTVPAPSPHSANSKETHAATTHTSGRPATGFRAPATAVAPGDAGVDPPVYMDPDGDGGGPPGRGRPAQRGNDGDGRADLSPEVEAAVRAGRMGGQLLGRTWRKCLLEALDDIGVLERDQAAKVAMVLEHWHSTPPSGKPAKSQVWYGRWRDWQREAMGFGKPTAKASTGMSSGLVSSRPRPTWDEPDEERRAAQ